MAKIKKQKAGGWADESIPDTALNTLRQITTDPEIEQRYRSLIGAYRDWRDYRNTMPAKNKELEQIQSVENAIDRLRKELNLLSEGAKAHMSYPLLKQKNVIYEQFERELTRHLRQLSALLGCAEQKVRSNPGGSGKGTYDLEKRLLNDVFCLIKPFYQNKNLGEIAGAAYELINQTVDLSPKALPSDNGKLLEKIPANSKSPR